MVNEQRRVYFVQMSNADFRATVADLVARVEALEAAAVQKPPHKPVPPPSKKPAKED